ncbi:MAG: flagellar hook-associated protein FlgL [Ignavibacteriales bacterium]|nr:flagellar hook-associated protein FlgL [Ignavibacteriales bacterium]
MRVTDFILQNSYLKNLNAHRVELNKIQKQITTQQKINQPSDSPLGSARLLRYSGQLGDISTYQKNVQNSSAFVNKTMLSLQSMHDIAVNAQTDLVNLGNPLIKDSYKDYSDKMDYYIKSIVDLANSDYDGKSLFAGTSLTTKPFSYDDSTGQVSVTSSDISGAHKIKISKALDQQINIPGDELFMSALKNSGNFDVSAADGTTTTLVNTINDADGNVYNISIAYTKSAANNYSLQYNITDSDSNVIKTESHSLEFNSSTGALKSIDGGSPSKINVEIDSHKIKMLIDPTKLVESNKATSITQAQNMKGDVFDTLNAIKNLLKNGEKPNANQTSLVDQFASVILNKASEAGNVYNRLSNSTEQLQYESTELQKMVSTERDTDVAQAVLDLQNRQYALDLSYKVSSMILPKSLLDYL